MVEAHHDILDAGARQHWTGPLVVNAEPGERLETLSPARRVWIDAMVLQCGAALFRGFGVDSAASLGNVSINLCDRLVDYVYRSTPRTAISEHVYTATEYRADSAIPLHNENSYQRSWPMKLVFACIQPSATGGETPLACTAAVTRRIDVAVRQEFAARRIMYVRNYGNGIDLPWETTFQTRSKADVEAFCLRNDIQYEWLDGERLRTKQVCHAIARHAVNGTELWFNQAHLFHLSSLGAEDACAMIDLFGEANLPRHAFFGDGGRIDEAMLTHIRQAYENEAFTFEWQRGDVLLVDNMLVAHGRRPYTGQRQVLVTMGDTLDTRSGPDDVSNT